MTTTLLLGLPMSRRALRAALRPFYPEITNDQVRELVAGGSSCIEAAHEDIGSCELSFEDLKDLLVDNPPQVSSASRIGLYRTRCGKYEPCSSWCSF
jgi:hypothetical protein